VNLIVPETVSRLHEVVVELNEDRDIKVAIFTSSLPDFFFNHFDLAHANEFPVLPSLDFSNDSSFGPL
jgi:enoyl-CoA hydratase/carnithine racemase